MSEGAAGVSKKSYAGDDRGIPPFKSEGWGTRRYTSHVMGPTRPSLPAKVYDAKDFGMLKSGNALRDCTKHCGGW
jgi:hypothetical protein